MAFASALLVHVHVLGVDHLVGTAAVLRSGAAGGRAAGSPRARASPGARGAFGLVETLGHLVRRLLEGRGGALHLRRILGFQRLLGVGDGLLEIALLVRTELLLVLVVGLLGVVHQSVKTLAGRDLTAPLLVLLAVRLGLLHHALDLAVLETGRGGDGDLLLLA